MNWREFSKANKGMLLTLPGAALYSIPVAYIAMPHFRQWIPFALPVDGLFPIGMAVMLVLLPTSAVCSFFAIRFYERMPEASRTGVTALLLLFNFIAGSLSGFLTVALFIGRFTNAFQ